MRLTELQSRRILHRHGTYATDACDKCSALLGPIRWTIIGEKGAWCAKKCRDGIDHKNGACHGCGVSLSGMRKHAKYCSDVCRKRRRVLDLQQNPERPIANKGLAEAISRFGYGHSTGSSKRVQKATNAKEALS